MSIVHVKTDTTKYCIHIAPKLIQQLATSVPEDASAIVLISNPTILELYGEAAQKSLAVTGKKQKNGMAVWRLVTTRRN